MREITDLKEIQNIELGILKFVDKVCKENNIKYSISSGTALGAIRHKGFIPWDDDVDIMMLREDYQKFLNVMDNLNDKNFKCLYFNDHTKDFSYMFAKVVDLSTTLTELNYINNEDMGIYIDIFPIDDMPDKNLKKIIKKHKDIQSLTFLASAKHFKKSKKGFLRALLKFPSYIYAKMFGWKHWVKKEMKMLDKIEKVSTENCGYYGGFGEKEIMPKSLYNEYIDVEFEGHKFPLVKNYDYYLSRYYGDYMTPPPKEKQITHHNFIAYKKNED